MNANRVKILSQSVVGVLVAIWSGSALAQISHVEVRPLASNIIVPQSRGRAFASDRRDAIQITGISATIDILESTATTTIEIRLQNTTNRRQEAELIVPVPDGAVRRFRAKTSGTFPRR